MNDGLEREKACAFNFTVFSPPRRDSPHSLTRRSPKLKLYKMRDLSNVGLLVFIAILVGTSWGFYGNTIFRALQSRYGELISVDMGTLRVPSPHPE